MTLVTSQAILLRLVYPVVDNCNAEKKAVVDTTQVLTCTPHSDVLAMRRACDAKDAHAREFESPPEANRRSASAQ